MKQKTLIQNHFRVNASKFQLKCQLTEQILPPFQGSKRIFLHILIIILPLWGLQISLKGWPDYKNKRNPAEKTPKE